jgi:hypothetical protein
MDLPRLSFMLALKMRYDGCVKHPYHGRLMAGEVMFQRFRRKCRGIETIRWKIRRPGRIPETFRPALN